MRRIRITVSYDGTDYYGWQVQPVRPTIQGTIERVLEEIEGGPVKVIGSGRTDAGVHALAQVAAFDLVNPIPVENLRKAMNRLLPAAIRVTEVAGTVPGFHPRHDAVAKTYEYRIWRAEICPPFIRRYLHHHPFPLDSDRMREVVALFEGKHDFSAFAASDATDALGRSKVRVVFSSALEVAPDRLVYRVRGSGFLKHMVRNMMGTLLEAGKGNLGNDQLVRLLQPGCREKAGPTAPACGLFLVNVEYPAPPPDGTWTPF
jgi:tRNA pseudouridine38-40 synthase